MIEKSSCWQRCFRFALAGRYPPLVLPPQAQHEQTTSLLIDWLKELADRQPSLFVIVDLQWVDLSTMAFVEQIVDRGLADRILTVLTFRPELETPWKSKTHQTNLALNRLTRRQIQELMEQKARRKLPVSLVEQIVERTDGVPLFVEEYCVVACSGVGAGSRILLQHAGNGRTGSGPAE